MIHIFNDSIEELTEKEIIKSLMREMATKLIEKFDPPTLKFKQKLTFAVLNSEIH